MHAICVPVPRSSRGVYFVRRDQSLLVLALPLPLESVYVQQTTSNTHTHTQRERERKLISTIGAVIKSPGLTQSMVPSFREGGRIPSSVLLSISTF